MWKIEEFFNDTFKVICKDTTWKDVSRVVQLQTNNSLALIVSDNALGSEVTHTHTLY